MSRESNAQFVTKGVPYHLWQNAMRMAIAEYKAHCAKVNAPDLSKRNWLIFKLRKEGKLLKEIGDIVGLSPNGVRMIEVKCCKALLKNMQKLKQKEPKAWQNTTT